MTRMQRSFQLCIALSVGNIMWILSTAASILVVSTTLTTDGALLPTTTITSVGVQNYRHFANVEQLKHQQQLQISEWVSQQQSHINDDADDVISVRNRQLQAVAPTSAPLCNPDGSVNFVDENNAIVFATTFQPNCTCEEGKNREMSYSLDHEQSRD
jgi:hypothetical protein